MLGFRLHGDQALLRLGGHLRPRRKDGATPGCRCGSAAGTRGRWPPASSTCTSLIGLRVLDEAGTEIGRVTDVLETGANDVFWWSRTPAGREHLFPHHADVVLRRAASRGDHGRAPAALLRRRERARAQEHAGELMAEKAEPPAYGVLPDAPHTRAHANGMTGDGCHPPVKAGENGERIPRFARDDGRRGRATVHGRLWALLNTAARRMTSAVVALSGVSPYLPGHAERRTVMSSAPTTPSFRGEAEESLAESGQPSAVRQPCTAVAA
ncbi:MAG: hypothetical protein KatS3mg059_1415 [Thermomicrobiales bacterium]|nr:MAG: hypothetical protein KatS3mg059_1415 [Thermomicrobiales bacterium]